MEKAVCVCVHGSVYSVSHLIGYLTLLSSSHVSPEQYRHRYACLTFTVMDYDWLSTNDFAGEAVAPLSDFCWPGRPNASAAGKNVQPVILHLSRSKPSGTNTVVEDVSVCLPSEVILRI